MIPSKFTTENGILYYTIKDDTVTITEYSGKDLIVSIPEKIKSKPVTVIKKKAFLSQRFIKEINIPESIIKIEDYAFARCRKLEQISLPYKNLLLGQDILKDCNKLSYIFDCNDSEKASKDVAFLLAKTLNELDAFFLFDLENAGSDEWLAHLDSTIEMRMKKDDMEDFSKMILCGEEEVVCGEDGTIEDSNPEHYKSNRVKEKVRISFMRLLHNYKINKDLEKILKDYLLAHIKGCATEETWEVVLNEYGDEQEYYDFLLNNKGITKNNMSDILLDMGNRHTEMKSYLIRYFDECDDENVFSDFDL